MAAELKIAGRASAARKPWATLLVAALAVVVFAQPRFGEALVYDRGRILGGDWWRLVTGHWVHFGASHLGWNLAVLVPAGVWAERLAPGRTRWFFVVAPVVIGVALFAFDPALERYAGLSGVAAGVLALLALTQLAVRPADAWFWGAVLGLLAVKIAAEFLAGRPIFARFGLSEIQAVPLAHVAGVACAAAVHFIRRRPV